MPLERKRVWSLWRQMPGNLVPVLITLPILLLSVQEMTRFGPTLKGFLLGLGFFVVGWFSVNFFGLMGNGSLKRAIEMRFKDRYEYDADERFFVGISRPGRHGLLDPHEDLGFLVFREGVLEFFGEVNQIELDWSSITRVGKRSNVHSWLGLGGWIAIDAMVGEKAVRLQVEPRVKATHWGNARFMRVMVKKIEDRILGNISTPA